MADALNAAGSVEVRPAFCRQLIYVMAATEPGAKMGARLVKVSGALMVRVFEYVLIITAVFAPVLLGVSLAMGV